MSKSAIERLKKARNHPMYGKKHSEITLKKMRKVKIGNKNPMYGKISGNSKGGYNKRNIPVYDLYAPQIDYCEQVRRNEEDSNILEVKCAYCGKWCISTIDEIRRRIQALNGEMSNGAENRLYCSTQCKRECPIYYKHKYQVGHPDSNKSQYTREVQAELRQMCFDRDNYTCQKCGKHQNELEVGLHCHHLTGVELNPIESADIDNCITLCKECHKWVHGNICPINTMRRKKC